MKRCLLLAILLPFFAIAQTNTKTKVKIKSKIPAAPVSKAPDEFLIEGELNGFPDGTLIALLNGQTGTPESETTIKSNKFSFRGKIAVPDFKIILVNKQPPYITLFLDNSLVRISGSRDAVDKAIITGSPSHAEYVLLNNTLVPYQKVFDEGTPYDSVAFAKALAACVSFVKDHPTSYSDPLAIIRYSQIADDYTKTEEMYNSLPPKVKSTSMGMYLAQYITDSKRNAVGSILPDFIQADTTGKPFSLSSLRGKYVLIDFWASWCRPCRMENPNVVAAYNKYSQKNFTILGVSLDQAKPAWVDAINMDGLTWHHVSDLHGWNNAVAQQFQIVNIPQNILVGPDGKIIGKNLRGSALDRKLGRILR